MMEGLPVEAIEEWHSQGARDKTHPASTVIRSSPGNLFDMGWFGSKDWNIVAVIFERHDLYRVNGNRGKGGDATTIRDAVKAHPRTIFWAVFDQKGAYLEGGPAAGANSISGSALQKLIREAVSNPSIREVLAVLESGKENKLSKPLVWSGYPARGEGK